MHLSSVLTVPRGGRVADTWGWLSWSAAESFPPTLGTAQVIVRRNVWTAVLGFPVFFSKFIFANPPGNAIHLALFLKHCSFIIAP